MPKKEERAQASTLEEALEVGFRGVEVDPTPNSAYTVAGVTSASVKTPEEERNQLPPPDGPNARGGTDKAPPEQSGNR